MGKTMKAIRVEISKIPNLLLVVVCHYRGLIPICEMQFKMDDESKMNSFVESLNEKDCREILKMNHYMI